MPTRYENGDDWIAREWEPSSGTAFEAGAPGAGEEGELIRLDHAREGASDSQSRNEWTESLSPPEHESGFDRPRVRILWPALGFPAVIAPRANVSGDPVKTSDATRCLTLLVVTDRKILGADVVAASLRYVPWSARGRRQLPAGATGSFDESDIRVPTNRTGMSLVVPDKKDAFGEMLTFGGDVDGRRGIAGTLSAPVRNFYRAQGLEHLHEIRISERASAQLADGLYHLFWNNQRPGENAPSDELAFLLERFARPRRAQLAAQWPQHAAFLLHEYEYEYRPLHPLAGSPVRGRRSEILHPVFVTRATRESLRVGHLTDTHVCVRADVYGHNLARAGSTAAYNNWNTSFTRAYDAAKQDSDILLLTGDLIDYGRGHWGRQEGDKLGQDGMYQVDRNWFLFHDLLASSDAYRVPAYTILGNHDWRINPYPPFAVVGAPAPRLLLHDHARYTTDQQRKILETAHGPGHQAQFSYKLDAENGFGDKIRKAGTVLKALGSLLAQTKTMDVAGSPAETTIASVEWYLLAINPFFDYMVTLPGGHQLLMLDWAEDEDVLFPVVYRGKEWPYMLWQLDEAADPGPKARRSLTEMQKWLVEQLIESPGSAKLIGIHAPPIGPYPDWKDEELLIGRKTYANPRRARGPTHYATKRPDGTIDAWNGHPIFAFGPRNGDAGVVADYGSFSRHRDWFIKALANPKHGIRAVFSGHIHRNGLFVVHGPGESSRKLLGGELLVRVVVPQAARGARPPAVTRTPEGIHGPLYVVTTSAGPRGNNHFREPTDAERKAGGLSLDPGFAHVDLAADGTIRHAEFRFVDTGAAKGRESFEEVIAAPREAWTFDESTLAELIGDVEREAFADAGAEPERVPANDDVRRRVAEALESVLGGESLSWGEA